MSDLVVKEGWVQNKSKYLKQWKKRWLVLREKSLSAYSHVEDKSPMLNLALEDIVETYQCHDAKNRPCFSVKTLSDEYLLVVSNEIEQRNWLAAISNSKKAQVSSEFLKSNSIYEKISLTQAELISVFCRLKAELNSREAELLGALSRDYAERKDQGGIVCCELQKALNELETQHAQEQCEHSASKLESIKRKAMFMPRAVDFGSADSLLLETIEVALNPENVENLVPLFIDISLVNPSELHIRRTKITRALKWMYASPRVDAISFTVSKDVDLTAIGLCIPYKHGGVTEILEFKILEGHSTDSSCVYRHHEGDSITFNPKSSVFKVELDNAVRVKKHLAYTVKFYLQGDSTFKCVDCLPSIKGPDRTTWAFYNTEFAAGHTNNRCDVLCGPIADFYYTPANSKV